MKFRGPFCLKLASVLIVFGAAWLLRFESVVGTQVILPLRADALQYFSYAWNLKHRGVYSMKTPDFKKPEGLAIPDAVRTPGYPLFLTFFAKLKPDEKMLPNIALAQALLSTVTVAGVFLLGLQVLSFPWSLTAAALTAISPHLIVANSYILTETLFCFFLVCFALACALLDKKTSVWTALLAGGVLGAVTLVRPSTEYFILAAEGFLLLRYGLQKGARLMLGLILGFSLVFGPWVVRNFFVPPSGGQTRLMINFLHHGIYPDFKYGGDERTYGFPYRHDPRSGEIAKSVSSVMEEIISRFRKEPAKHIRWYLFGKPATFWSWSIVQGQGGAFVYPVARSPYFDQEVFYQSLKVMAELHWVFVGLAGLWATAIWIPSWQHCRAATGPSLQCWISLLLLYFTAIHMVGAPFPRYAVPLRPFIYIMALIPLDRMITCWKEGTRGRFSVFGPSGF